MNGGYKFTLKLWDTLGNLSRPNNETMSLDSWYFDGRWPFDVATDFTSSDAAWLLSDASAHSSLHLLELRFDTTIWWSGFSYAGVVLSTITERDVVCSR